MKRFIGALYLIFPAVLLFGQPARTDRLPEVRNTLLQRLRNMPKSFPPEIMPAAGKTSFGATKLSRGQCVYPSADHKSFEVKRCEAVTKGPQLMSPFKSIPAKRSAPSPSRL